MLEKLYGMLELRRHAERKCAGRLIRTDRAGVSRFLGDKKRTGLEFVEHGIKNLLISVGLARHLNKADGAKCKIDGVHFVRTSRGFGKPAASPSCGICARRRLWGRLGIIARTPHAVTPAHGSIFSRRSSRWRRESGRLRDRGPGIGWERAGIIFLAR